MRKPVHTSVIKFRASETLLASAEALAQQQSMSLSELMREALRRAVDQAQPQDTVPPVETAVGLSQILFAAAARGSLDAHRQIRDGAMQMAADQTAPFDQAFAVAESFARLASSIGSPHDRMVLAGLLLQRAEFYTANDHEASFPIAQALAQIDAAADGGDQHATAWLERAAAEVPKQVFELAQELQAAGATA